MEKLLQFLLVFQGKINTIGFLKVHSLEELVYSCQNYAISQHCVGLLSTFPVCCEVNSHLGKQGFDFQCFSFC